MIFSVQYKISILFINSFYLLLPFLHTTNLDSYYLFYNKFVIHNVLQITSWGIISEIILYSVTLILLARI